MRLNKKQRALVLKWVAEGLLTDAINHRAAAEEPPFEVSRQQVDGYRKRSRLRIAQLVETSDSDALKSGPALKEERVKLLKDLADLLKLDIFGAHLWVTDVRLSMYTRVDIERFNAAEVEQLRGVLDDIAKEMGERKIKADLRLPGANVVVYVPDNGRNPA